MLAGAARDPQHIQRLRADGMVIADFSTHGVAQATVAALESPGTRELLDALGSLGHRRISYVHPGQALGGAGRRRWQAIGQQARRRGIGVERVSMGGDRQTATVAGRLTELLGRADPPTALICSTHGLAPALLGGLAAADMELPDQCSFVTYGDSAWAAAYRPAISVVTSDLYAVARALTEAMIRELTDQAPATAEPVPPARFIHRASLGPAVGH